MKIRRHYLTLRRAYAHVQEGASVEATTQELAELLACTHRNMVMLLKRMQQEEWLQWQPKRGRGNRSLLTFIAGADALMLQEAQELVHKQDLQGALAIVQSAQQSASVQVRFQQWLAGQFGFHSEVQGNRRTDILRFPLPQTIHSLDPAAIHYTGESHLVNQLFDGLVRMDAKGESILPHLAHAWEVDESRTLWTFYLRKGVLFHNGRELSSSDVKYSLERLRELAPSGLHGWVYAGIASMETPDDTTIRIRLAERNEVFLSFLATNRASIVPQDACDAETGQFLENPVGTGPFKLAGHEQGVWVLEAFAPYFQGRAFLDRVEIWTLEEAEDRLMAPELASFQLMHNVRMSETASEQWQQVRQSGMTCKFITVNELKHGPLANPSIREAIDLAINRERLLELLSGDVIEEGISFWLHQESATPDGMKQSDPTSVAEIRVLLAEAGYNGEKLVLATIPQYESDAALIKQVCAAAGVAIEIRLIAAEEFKGKSRLEADFLLFAIMLDEHRELRLVDLYKSMQQHMLPAMYRALDDQLQSILSEADPQQRKALFLQIEEELKRAHSLIFLYRKHLKTAFHPSVRGISLESLGWVRFRDIWFT
ncbi:ABC transporter substrate-binding protein [Paenibacillus harenae]|uniref:MarR-like DNA-binding transcriptional regulator SgrR of sgrS sRNA n=1 Tax=Paenibacillus harenae TaxID=306543 RepID=A0ABT9U3X2_PAEHA|nr:ABC transporter substrate-binding protein [Paenibacillus harenae]MDQ0113937.1 MarR-like DNA-binding transcriptional regulator SgrR of sgrS sRNA [Paenibacillus harenae]